MFRFNSALVPLYAALCLALLAQPALPECSGAATRRSVGGHVQWTLSCLANPCTEGCVRVSVTTPNGSGIMCQCNYIGPHPNCCSTVVVQNGNPHSEGSVTTTGVCGDPGCPPSSGTCHVGPSSWPSGGIGLPVAATCDAQAY